MSFLQRKTKQIETFSVYVSLKFLTLKPTETFSVKVKLNF
jgi:hypothetical protein